MPKESVQKALLQAQHSAKQMGKAIRIWADKDLRREMTQASREAAKEAVPYIRAHTPRSEGPSGGTLQRNIKHAGTRTTPKVKAGTKTRGGPYAWMVHSGHKLRDGSRYGGVPYVKLGLKEAYPLVLAKYLEGQREVAKKFNNKLKRNKVPGIGKVSF